MPSSIEKTIQVLQALNRCEPRKAQSTNLESKAKTVADGCLGISLLFLVATASFIFFYDTRPASLEAKTFVVAMSAISTLLALIALVAPIVVTVLLAFRWKKLAFESLCNDVRHEQAMADGLAAYEPCALKDAHFWLERRIRRISERTGRFFGEKTAAVGLLATAYSFAAEFGGFEWISRTLVAGFRMDNLGNTVLLGVGAFLLGMSIGSIALGHLAARYRYQLEVIELVDRAG